jgi:ankyrin repeat protein
VRARDKYSATPLHVAAAKCPALIKMLIMSGACLRDLDVRGRSAVHVAAAEGRLDTLWLLVAEGACMAEQVRRSCGGRCARDTYKNVDSLVCKRTWPLFVIC